MISVERVVTHGTFCLDGETWDVDNNVWLYGGESEVVVIDAAHEVRAIASAVGGRPVKAILCTHAHNDHINVVLELAMELDAPVLLHPDDRMLWDVVHDRAPDGDLTDGQVIGVAGTTLTVMHTPGHSPGGVCLVGPGLVVSGDTLFHGGPGGDGAQPQPLPDDPRLDPREAAGPSAGHCRSHRARRRHHYRRRGFVVRRLGCPWALGGPPA